MSKEKQFLTVEEAAQSLQRNRATVYNRMKLLDMKAHKFAGSRKAFLSREEVERLRLFDTSPAEAGAPEKHGEKQEEVA